MFSLPRKELFEIGFKQREIEKVIAFGSAVTPVFQRDISSKLDMLVDMCAGNGLCSFAFQFNGFAQQALMIDSRKPRRFDRLKTLFERYGFSYEYKEQSIDSSELKLNYGKQAIVSIHPCSELGDMVIELGVSLGIPFAIMTCCHKKVEKAKRYRLKNHPDPRLHLYREPADYFDAVRQRFVEEQGWKCYSERVPEKITRKNHIIIGVRR